MKHNILINSRNWFFKTLNNHLIDYPTPINLNYAWSFGSLTGIFFVIQILTGVFLAMHYVPDVNLAFNSIEHIMRDVQYGWLLRYLHSNGASMVFILLYIHIGKGLYYKSYTHKRIPLWFSGIIIFFLMMITAFIGYVLPWGQMSFWGATVITNMVTAIPGIGQDIAYWIWGGFSLSNPTLNRFLSLHYLLPFITTAIIFLHLILLHSVGSSNPLGIDSNPDKVGFYPYFFLKDSVALFTTFTLYTCILFFFPNLLNHPDNYIPANTLVTPPHIVPEWYFLPFYAMLRSFPNKLTGVLYMAGSILILVIIPYVDTSPWKSPKFRPYFKIFFWGFVILFGWLGFLGGLVADRLTNLIALHSVFAYFGYFLIILPFISAYEWKIAQTSIQIFKQSSSLKKN